MLSLVGGKWTTFRALAEHLSNDVLAELGMERKVSTAKLAIGGGAGFPDSEDGVQRWIKAHMSAGRDAARVTGLLTRYGTRAEEVIRFLDGAAAGEPDRLLHSTRELSTRELEFMAAHEQIGHLVDVLIRRTSLAFRGLVTGELLNEVADILSGPLGWDAARRATEISHAQEVLQAVPRRPGPQPGRLIRPCVPGQGSPGASTARSAPAAGAVAGRQHEHAAGPTASKLAEADNRK